MLTDNVSKAHGVTNGTFARVVALRPGTLLLRLVETRQLVALPRSRVPTTNGRHVVGYPISYEGY